MPQRWIRLDTTMPDHPKVLALLEHRNGHRAAFVWVGAMCYTGRHGTDGYIPAKALGLIAGRQVDMALLVTAGLLDVAPGGWLVHGWNKYQPSDAETQARSKRGQEAARARWDKRTDQGSA